jgi:hypothetical protein
VAEVEVAMATEVVVVVEPFFTKNASQLHLDKFIILPLELAVLDIPPMLPLMLVDLLQHLE